MKVSIIYHSQTGNTQKMAELIAEGVQSVEGTEVKLMEVDKYDAEYIKESDAVIFGSPIYSASLSWKMKQFFDTAPLNLSGKLGGVFTTSDYVGGGDSIGELVMITAMLVRAMLIYSGGVFEGQPHTHIGATAIKDGDEWQKDRAKIFGERIANKAKELFVAPSK